MQNKTNIIPIVMMADKNYVLPATVMLNSLYSNKNAGTEYSIYVLADNMDDDTISVFEAQSKPEFSVKVVKIDNPYKDYENKNPNMSCTTFLKFEIPFLFEQYDRVLYLDVDTIILKDLSDLYNFDIKDNYAAAVEDFYLVNYNEHKKIGLKTYFNAGIMLFNTKKIREDFSKGIFGETYINNTDKFLHHDQDVFNVVFSEKIAILPAIYNWMVSNIYFRQSVIRKFYKLSKKDCTHDKIAIIHYTSRLKPWKYNNVPFGKEWLQYYSALDKNIDDLNLKSCNLLKTYFYIRGIFNLKLLDISIKYVKRCFSK